MDKQLKVCRDCGETLPIESFAPDARRRDGRTSYCRGCFAVRYRRHRERKAAAEGRTIKARRQVPAGSKYCPRCEKVQPRENFGSNRSSRDGLTGYCKPCHNDAGRTNRERLYGSTREYHLRRRYGLTSAEVDAMIEAQGGTCAVCPGKPEHVDHDHETGRVRGVLCFNCNQALGNVRDDVEVLRGLIRYLHRHALAAAGGSITEVQPPTDVVFEITGPLHAA